MKPVKGADMFCSKCGNQIEDGELFCGNCGTPVTVQEAGSKKSGKKRISVIYLILAAIFLAAVIVCFFSLRSMNASNIRLLGYDGTVNLCDSDGKELKVSEGKRLVSGNKLDTGKKSKAWILLDDDRSVTLFEKSAVSINSKGKNLVLLLDDGKLFFNISKPLADDESFEITTSTMVIGIRGTSGYVDSDENGCSVLYLTSGKVEVSSLDEDGEEVMSVKVDAGYKVTVMKIDGVWQPVVEKIEETDIPSEAVLEMMDDDDLTDRIVKENDWDKDVLEDLYDYYKKGLTVEDYLNDHPGAADIDEPGETVADTGDYPEEISVEEALSDYSVLFGTWRPVVPEDYDSDPTYMEYVSDSFYCFYSDGNGYKARNYGNVYPEDAFIWNIDSSDGDMINLDVTFYTGDWVQHYTYDRATEILTIESYDFYRVSESIDYDFFAVNSYEATPDMVVGTWVLTGNYNEYTFNADGTGVLTNGIGRTSEFTWEITDGHFTCSESDVRFFNGKIQGRYYGWVDMRKK